MRPVSRSFTRLERTPNTANECVAYVDSLLTEAPVYLVASHHSGSGRNCSAGRPAASVSSR
jgi:hypothetical protein